MAASRRCKKSRRSRSGLSRLATAAVLRELKIRSGLTTSIHLPRCRVPTALILDQACRRTANSARPTRRQSLVSGNFAMPGNVRRRPATGEWTKDHVCRRGCSTGSVTGSVTRSVIPCHWTARAPTTERDEHPVPAGSSLRITLNICGAPRVGLNGLASTDQPSRSGPGPAGRIALLVAVLPGSPGDAFGGGFGCLADGSGIAGSGRADCAGGFRWCFR